MSLVGTEVGNPILRSTPRRVVLPLHQPKVRRRRCAPGTSTKQPFRHCTFASAPQICAPPAQAHCILTSSFIHKVLLSVSRGLHFSSFPHWMLGLVPIVFREHGALGLEADRPHSTGDARAGAIPLRKLCWDGSWGLKHL